MKIVKAKKNKRKQKENILLSACDPVWLHQQSVTVVTPDLSGAV